MGDVIHNRPFVVQAGPGTPSGAHFQNHAAERPDVDGALTAFAGSFDHFGGHVHGRACHGLLLAGGAPGGAGRRRLLVELERFPLAGDYLGGAEIDVFYYTVVVEEDIYQKFS